MDRNVSAQDSGLLIITDADIQIPRAYEAPTVNLHTVSTHFLKYLRIFTDL